MWPQVLVTFHVVHWGYKQLREGLSKRTLPLSAVPSVAAASSNRSTVACTNWERARVDLQGFADWKAQHGTHGVTSFLVCVWGPAGLLPTGAHQACFPACFCFRCKDATMGRCKRFPSIHSLFSSDVVVVTIQDLTSLKVFACEECQ
jgi:hypothetical protein